MFLVSSRQELGTRCGHSSEHPGLGRDSVTGSLFCALVSLLSAPRMCSGRHV